MVAVGLRLSRAYHFPIWIVQRTDFFRVAAFCSHFAIVSLFSWRITAAALIACHASGLPTCIIRLPASHILGSPTVRRALFSGPCQLSGTEQLGRASRRERVCQYV